MANSLKRRQPDGAKDYFALALTTFGVGYSPIAPGTAGSAVGVLIYIVFGRLETYASGLYATRLSAEATSAAIVSVNALALLVFTIAGIWASGHSIELLGDKDPSEAVVDEVIGQLITFLFVPFAISWGFVAAGFLLFRLFDIWKPFPINTLQNLPGGIGVCADDILAGTYAGICLAVIYAFALWI